MYILYTIIVLQKFNVERNKNGNTVEQQVRH